jgi:hypothetical protein
MKNKETIQVVVQIDASMWREFKVLAAHQNLGTNQMLRLVIDQTLVDNPDPDEPILFDGPRVLPKGPRAHEALGTDQQWVCNGGVFEIVTLDTIPAVDTDNAA